MFERLGKFFISRPYLLVSLLLVFFLFYNIRLLTVSKKQVTQTFQSTFISKISSLETYSLSLLREMKHGKIPSFNSRELLDPADCFVHVYRNDSLIYWNDNQVPVSNYADLHFPINGVSHLQNGWYYSITKTVGIYKLVTTFGIQHEYPVINEVLKNRFYKPFDFVQGDIAFTNELGDEIKDDKTNSSFYLHVHNDQLTTHLALSFIFFSSLSLLVVVWFKFMQLNVSVALKLICAFGLITLRLASLHFGWLEALSELKLFDPGLLALNEWLPNLGEVLVWVVVLVLFSWTISQEFKRTFSLRRWMLVPSLIGLFVVSLIFPFAADRFVENSTIPLQLNQLFSLDRFTVIILLLFGIGGLVFVQLTRLMIRGMLRLALSKRRILVVFSCYYVFLIALSFCTIVIPLSWLIWPILLSIVTVIISVFYQDHWGFTSVLLAVLIFAAGTTFNIESESEEKEKQVREVYANQLADDRDVSAEVEFSTVPDLIKTDPYINRLFSGESKPRFTELKNALERRVFSGFWERYDVDCYYFSLAEGKRMNGYTMAGLERIIRYHGTVSEVDSSLFFIEDYTSQFNYIFKFPIVKDGQTVVFYGTLKSKRIPEKIGFPRLLISEKANVYQTLADYSIGKYYKSSLVSTNGNYSYPVDFDKIWLNNKGSKAWVETEGYSHYILKRSSIDAIVLSKRNSSFFDSVTTMAFLLIGYGTCLFMFIGAFRLYQKGYHKPKLSLAVKIQVVMISLVVISLLGFSIGSSTFVSQQYEDFSSDAIRERIRSVTREATQMFGDKLDFATTNGAGELDFELLSLAKIFVTDINIYLPTGRLISSSRPKIYNIGLSSEQMNPDAMHNMVSSRKSEYIHQERIGELTYLSAYVPFKNSKNELIGYLNLQHFDQQNVYEDQVQRFFVAIVNVFMLLLVLSIVGAILVSGWLTKPLRLIRTSFSKVELGKNNQRIVYSSKDEVGDLIHEYNLKLEELEGAARLLAQSERETAWREMAKQVAHEIKNPLTPMKLSIQQLQRVFDPNDPTSGEKLKRVAQSVIEQIDALATIANAFSNFAKLPQPVFQEVNILELIQSVTDFFNSDSEAAVIFERKDENILISGDKEMLLRVLNNLVSNGIQSLAIGEQANIVISYTQLPSEIQIHISDNGQGIHPDQLDTIFEPYFTTKSTGTGLGLAMVKQIVESHGGSISVQNSSSKGTRIMFSLPTN